MAKTKPTTRPVADDKLEQNAVSHVDKVRAAFNQVIDDAIARYPAAGSASYADCVGVLRVVKGAFAAAMDPPEPYVEPETDEPGDEAPAEET